MTHLLRNVLYTGRVLHRDQVYDGEHEAIVSPDLWDATQALLDGDAPRPPSGHHSPLAGRLNDSDSRPMVAQHANKGGRRYRYYVSRDAAGSRSHLTRIARLRFLAPDIITPILDGRQPVELTARTLIRIPGLPLCWVDQRRMLGYH